MTNRLASRTSILGSVAIASLLLVGGAACSSSQEPMATPAPTEAQVPGEAQATSVVGADGPESTEAPTDQDVGDDTETAELALLTADEVPGGTWVEGDLRGDEPPTGLDCEQMPEESDFFNERAKDAPGAKAPEIVDQDTETVLELDINILASSTDTDRVEAIFSDERFTDCLISRLDDNASSTSSEISEVIVEPIELEGIEYWNKAWAIDFTVSQGTQSVEISGVVAMSRIGRGFVQASFLSPGSVSTSMVESVLLAATEKLDDAFFG